MKQSDFITTTYILNDHDKEGELNTKGSLGVRWACDIVCADIGSCNLQDAGVNILIRDPLDVSVANWEKGEKKRCRNETS